MSILPHNATALEKHLESVMSRTEFLPVVVDRLWNYDACPENLLPWLAWAFSVDTWDSEWSDDVKRGMIANAIEIHKTKGTVAAVERVLETLGVNAELEEWMDYDGPPHTFRLTAWTCANIRPDAEVMLTPALYDALKKAIDNVKPVRSHYDFRVGVAFGSGTNINAATSATNAVRVSAHVANDVIARTGLGMTMQFHNISSVRILMEDV